MQAKEILLVIGLMAAVATAAAMVLARRRGRKHPSHAPVRQASDPAEPLFKRLERDLELAAEHVRSIRWLLAIAREHQQPIPPAVLTNLDLVSKHLGEMRRRTELAWQEENPERNLSGTAHRRKMESLPRPRPPSFGCRVSPCDRSMPCD